MSEHRMLRCTSRYFFRFFTHFEAYTLDCMCIYSYEPKWIIPKLAALYVHVFGVVGHAWVQNLT